MLKKIFDFMKKDKLKSAVLCMYALFCISSIVYFLCIGFVRNAIMSLVYMMFIGLMVIIERWLKIEFGALFCLIVFSIAAGSILGACYDVYTFIPCFDMILHGMSGFIFACLGFAVMEVLVTRKGNKNFAACLLFGAAFSFSIAVLWEIFEYSSTFLGFDMMADSIVTDIDSYFLAGTHVEPVSINGIEQTVIYYGNNQVYVIDGYLDIGLIDTMDDLIVCMIGTLFFILITAISYKWYPKINELTLPKIKNNL